MTMRILVVCSGNTCRSPLAAAMLSERIAQHRRLAGTEVTSAGTSAWPGSPASDGSLLVALERGIDLSSHRSRPLTAELVQGADLVLAMGDTHLRRVLELGGGGRASLLSSYGQDPDPADVPDPFGGNVEGYRATADAFDAMLEGVVAQLLADPTPRGAR